MDDLPLEFAEPLARLAPRLESFLARVVWLDEVGSTNDVALTRAERGDGEGTVIVADVQTAGRGRLGRSWASPRGAGLYMSIIVRPAQTSPLLTLAAGVAAADGIRAATGLVVDLKWPNDLYVGMRKVGGVLAEGGTAINNRPHVVVGIGVNVLGAAYPPEIAARATSIETELGRPADRGLLLGEILAAFASTYRVLQLGRSRDVLGHWRSRAKGLMNRRVEWDEMGQTVSGLARDVDDTGALLVDTGGGVRRIVAGEVRWS